MAVKSITMILTMKLNTLSNQLKEKQLIRKKLA